jgi:hypothetical protein
MTNTRYRQTCAVEHRSGSECAVCDFAYVLFLDLSLLKIKVDCTFIKLISTADITLHRVVSCSKCFWQWSEIFKHLENKCDYCCEPFFAVLSLFRTNILQTGPVAVIRCKGGKVPAQLGPLETARLNHCSTEQLRHTGAT